MTTLLYMLDEGKALDLLILIGVLAVVGGKMAAPGGAARPWGWRISALTFIAYCLRGGLTLDPQNADQWLHIVLRGLLAAGLTLGVSWVLLAVGDFSWRQAVALVQACWLRGRLAAQRREAEWISRGEALRRQVDRGAREQGEATHKAEATRRRDDARMRCLMLYDRHSTVLAGRFPRERLEQYFRHYMADSSPPEVVEERARTLIALLEEWVAQDKPREKKLFTSLEEIAAYFQRQRDEVAGLSYNIEVKDSLLANVNIQEEQAIRRFLSS